jgi:hypothetical protein
MAKVTKINIRMYRVGTGDFFLFRFYKGNNPTPSFKMMIDCGCIQGSETKFLPKVKNLQEETGNEIDLLIVTHEHADHINGFNLCKEELSKINFKNVWFAWTESKTDAFANDLRKNHSKLKLGLKMAAEKLNGLKDSQYYESYFGMEHNKEEAINNQHFFIDSINQLNDLNTLGLNGEIPTMEDILRDFKIIKDNTNVEFLSPGVNHDFLSNIAGLEGLRFFVLGPPKDYGLLSKEESKIDGYEKRESKSTLDLSFINALDDKLMGKDILPFDDEYEMSPLSASMKTNFEKGGDFDTLKSKNASLDDMEQIRFNYLSDNHKWRSIDNDWLMGAGSLGLRLQTSINNTSLALALQFEESERVLLLPGDAEYGNWMSWHNKDLSWDVKKDGKMEKVNAEYFLNKTVFYKVGHHLSQNGTAKEKGLEMMKSQDLTAMITLDLETILSGWKSTMPNDIIGEILFKQTKGKMYFVGKRDLILKNLKTHRVSFSQTHLDEFERLNSPFDANGGHFVECEITG